MVIIFTKHCFQQWEFLFNKFFLSTLDRAGWISDTTLTLHFSKCNTSSLNRFQLLSLILPTESTPPSLITWQLRLLSYNDWAPRYNVSQVFVISTSITGELNINTTTSTLLLTRTPNHYTPVGAISTFRHRFITLRHTRNAIATTTATRLRQSAKHLTYPTLVGETVVFFPFSPLFISHWLTFIPRVFSLFLVTLFTFAHCFVQAFQLIYDFISDFISFLIGSSRNHEWQRRVTFGGVTTWLISAWIL